jgi:hypothetical protein
MARIDIFLLICMGLCHIQSILHVFCTYDPEPNYPILISLIKEIN